MITSKSGADETFVEVRNATVRPRQPLHHLRSRRRWWRSGVVVWTVLFVTNIKAAWARLYG